MTDSIKIFFICIYFIDKISLDMKKKQFVVSMPVFTSTKA